MIRRTRALTPGSRTALALLALALTLAGAPALAAEGTVKYEKESEAAFAQQLAKGEIQSASINKRLRTVRLTLKDGRHVLARYAAHEEPTVAKRLKAKHVPVTILGKAAAEKEAKKKPVHHKLRYIAGGILVAVIVVVGGVLLVNRRRQRD
jgi:ATP-dependent Zn protease